MISAKDFAPVIHVQLAYIALYNCFLYLQVGVTWYRYFTAPKGTTMAQVKYGISSSKAKPEDAAPPNKEDARLKLLAERTVGNTMEQAFPFLISFWLCAVFHNVDEAAFLGWCYLASRAIYPIGFRLGLPYLLFSTLPGYFIIFRMAFLVYSKTL